MISREQAIYLLNKYEHSLTELQKTIKTSYHHLLLCDALIVPNTLAALRAIAHNVPYVPEVSGLIILKTLNADPQEAIKYLFNGELKNHFRKMCTHYARGQLLENLLNFNASISQEKIILYKAKNGELALKFPTKTLRDQFISKLGGVSYFDSSDPHNGNQPCPIIYSSNPNTLFIKVHTAKNGELAAVFPNSTIHQNFLSLLRHASSIIYGGQDMVYFNDPNLHRPEVQISIHTPACSKSSDAARADVRFATRTIGQALRDPKNKNCFFNILPAELNNKILCLSGDNDVLSEEEVLSLVESNLGKPK